MMIGIAGYTRRKMNRWKRDRETWAQERNGETSHGQDHQKVRGKTFSLLRTERNKIS